MYKRLRECLLVRLRQRGEKELIIKKLSIKGFGRINNYNINLSSGFNIVYGRNESGKSTLQAFIKGMLYGLNKKKKKDEISELERYKPWDTNEFAGMIEYEKDGFNYKVGRNFNTDKVSLCNEFWDDITTQFPTDKKKGSLFAETHIGMSEECFERTIFVRQLQSIIKDDSKDILDRLINIQETGQEDISYRKAIEVLETVLKDKIGSEKTNKKPLNLINTELDRLTKEKNEVGLVRTEILQIEEKIKDIRIKRQELAEEIENCCKIKQSIKREGLLELYNKAIDYENKIEMIENEIGRLKTFVDFPIHLEDRFREISQTINNIGETIKSKNAYLLELQSKIKSSEEEASIQSEDSQIVYNAVSHYKIMKHALDEKSEYEEKLGLITEELKGLEENQHLNENKEEQYTGYNEYSDDNNPLSNKDNEFTLENVLYQYQELTKLRQNEAIVSQEIDKNKYEIEETEAVLLTLKPYSILPKDIDERLVGLDKSDGNSLLVKQKINTLVIQQNAYKTKIPKYIFAVLASVSTALYGAFSVFSSLNTVFMIISLVGVVSSFFFETKLIVFILKINNMDKRKRAYEECLKSDNDIHKEADIDFSQIIETTGAKDMVTFLKDLYSYREANNKYTVLETAYNSKKENLQNIREEIIKLENQLSQVLVTYNIQHEPKSINQGHITVLREIFDKSENSNVAKKNAVSVNNDLDLLNTKNEIKFKQTAEELNLKRYEVKSIKEIISKLEDKIANADIEIKSALDLFCVPYNKDFPISEKEIDALQDKFNERFSLSSQISGLKAIEESIALELNKLKKDKQLLEREKEEILENSMLQSEQEFTDGCLCKRRLDELLVDKERLINIYNELTRYETSQEILQKLSSLDNRLINVDKAYESEDIEAKQDRLNIELKQIDEEIINFNNQANSKLNGKKDLNEITEQINWLQEEKNRLEESKEAIEVALEVLKESSREVQRNFSPKFQREISMIINRITGGRYKEVKANEKLSINVIDPDIGLIVEGEKLSSGTIEQLYLALRIALSNILSPDDKLPLIIDEAFIQYDDARTKNVLEFLLELSNERQIILFTCQKREIDIVNNLGAIKNANIIELAS